MFWNRKKEGEKKAAPPVPAASPVTLAPSAARAGGAHAKGNSGKNPSTIQFLTGDSDLDRRSVEVLLEAIARVSEARNLDELLVDIVDRSIEIAGAERGLLILAGSEAKGSTSGESGLTLRVARAKGGESIDDDVRFSTSIVKRVLEGGNPVKATVQSDSDALELGRSVFDLKLRAVMCVPLSAPTNQGGDGRAARGVLYVDSKAATREFSSRDLSLFAALSQHISIALENARLHLHSIEKTRLEQSLELASAIQSGLMPPIPRDVTALEVHGWYRPAERTSGDFFDFVKTKDQRLAVIVGDVTGHGMGPALITAAAQASLRSFLRVVPDVGTAVTMLNQDLSERVDPGMFVTLLVCAIRSDGDCEILNAGHHEPLLWRKATGKIETVVCSGVALGLDPQGTFTSDCRLKLETGDLMLAYTDGLIEAPSMDDRDNLYGEQRLRDSFTQLCSEGASTEVIAKKLAESALSFSGGAHDDDITLVVLR
ncbi:MAG: GAF domain-containing SpoIIE family protein phosphatase, partial [Planctomycetota bacterium]